MTANNNNPNKFIDRMIQACIITLVLIVVYLCLVCCRGTRGAEKVNITDISTEYQEYMLEQDRKIDSLVHIIMLKDSAAVHHTERDSTYHNILASDTLVTKDSVFVRERADGSVLEQYWHWKWATKTLVEWRDRLLITNDYKEEYHALVDSADRYMKEINMLKDSINSINSEIHTSKETIVKETSWPWYAKPFMYVGIILSLLSIIAVLYVGVKNGWLKKILRRLV